LKTNDQKVYGAEREAVKSITVELAEVGESGINIGVGGL